MILETLHTNNNIYPNGRRIFPEFVVLKTIVAALKLSTVLIKFCVDTFLKIDNCGGVLSYILVNMVDR